MNKFELDGSTMTRCFWLHYITYKKNKYISIETLHAVSISSFKFENTNVFVGFFFAKFTQFFSFILFI